MNGELMAQDLEGFQGSKEAGNSTKAILIIFVTQFALASFTLMALNFECLFLPVELIRAMSITRPEADVTRSECLHGCGGRRCRCKCQENRRATR